MAEDEQGWTAIGCWIDDQPIVTGMVRGHHEVEGGNDGYFEQGLWATYSEEPDLEEAEADAVATILDLNGHGDEEESEELIESNP